MKTFVVLVLILLITGCMSMKPVELSPHQLQEKILTGEVIQEGEIVRIETEGGTIHKFKVTARTAEVISGTSVDIPIDSIVSVRTREFSGGKTALGGASIWLILFVVFSLAAAGF